MIIFSTQWTYFLASPWMVGILLTTAIISSTIAEMKFQYNQLFIIPFNFPYLCEGGNDLTGGCATASMIRVFFFFFFVYIKKKCRMSCHQHSVMGFKSEHLSITNNYLKKKKV